MVQSLKKVLHFFFILINQMAFMESKFLQDHKEKRIPMLKTIKCVN